MYDNNIANSRHVFLRETDGARACARYCSYAYTYTLIIFNATGIHEFHILQRPHITRLSRKHIRIHLAPPVAASVSPYVYGTFDFGSLYFGFLCSLSLHGTLFRRTELWSRHDRNNGTRTFGSGPHAHTRAHHATDTMIRKSAAVADREYLARAPAIKEEKKNT
jgi:hypothetical protein